MQAELCDFEPVRVSAISYNEHLVSMQIPKISFWDISLTIG